VFAQSSQASFSTSVPRLINVSGVYRPADKQPLTPLEQVTFAVYAQESGGTPLWQETQQVAVDAEGHYTVLLGATQPDGVPLDVFASGQAQWLGITFHRPRDVEGARMRITTVPYALHAADAVTLGGRPASDYVLTPTKNGLATTSAASTTATTDPTVNPLNVLLTGTPNALAKYVNADDVGASAVSELSGRVGINTGGALPFDYLHIRFTDPFGAFTGLAVQNLSNSANAASGMLFYDHNGALTQFQGFNNTNHAYVINNIAKNGANQFDGSYSFLLGSTPRFVVASTGNIGIGTTAPSALLEVSNAVPGGPANMWMTSYTNAVNPYYLARRARGTPGAPAAVQNGDGLAGFYGDGYGTTAFGGGFAGGMTVQAVQNWTDTAHGTALTFATTAFNTTSSATRMTLDAGGNFGIGTSLPTALLEISNGLTPASPASATIATYNAAPGGSFLTGRKARGTPAAPTAVQNGDGLLSLSGRGYGTTQFGVGGGATIGIRATENYTNTAMGGLIQFLTTPNGTTTLTTRMTIDQSGFVGIGTNTPTGMLDIARDGTTNLIGTSYGGQGTGFKARASRGTLAAPTATQSGDELAEFTAAGYGTTGFNETAGWAAFAAENWTDAAQGTFMGFATTPVGSNEAQFNLVILPNGNIGVGTPEDVNGFPTATDKLQVFGDIRVGTTGTNGCLLNFAGSGLVGSCSSDRRLKKNITPFAPMLDKVTALQPVHYFWRSDEFPARHFGDGQNYGLIAQDVEQVLPELVVTNEDGYKAVDYSKLPLLAIQAVKDLKAENDALKERVTALERLINELTQARREN